MTRVCAWCGKNMGASSPNLCSEAIITHGICETCANTFFGELGMKLNAFLDSMDVPVVVVDLTAHVKASNRQARSFLQKDFQADTDYMVGDIFECVHAKRPGGCGHTVHCGGCAIKHAITDTFQSGTSHLKVPTFVNRGTTDDCRTVDLLISTEKVGEVVVLRIDEVGGREADQP